jgi:hypothetical protein
MGIKIDFGSVEVSERGKAGALSEGTWEAEPTEFKFSIAKTGTRQIEMTFKVTDEDAVDVDGNSFTGLRVWDSMYFTEKSAKMTKMKLKGLGYPVDDLVVSDDDDIQDLAADLTDSYLQTPVKLVTGLEDRDNGTQRARVKFINAA